MPKEKVRVYSLARKLNMESKDLLDLCRSHGLDLKNQLSSLDPDQCDLIEQLVKKGPPKQAPKTPQPSAPPFKSPFKDKKPIEDLAGKRSAKADPAPPPVEPKREVADSSPKAKPKQEQVPAKTEPKPEPEPVEKTQEEVTPAKVTTKEEIPAEPEPVTTEETQADEPIVAETRSESVPVESPEIKEQEDLTVDTPTAPKNDSPKEPEVSEEPEKPGTAAEETQPAYAPESPLQNPQSGSGYSSKVPSLNKKKIQDLGGGSKSSGSKPKPKPKPAPTPYKISPPPPIRSKFKGSEPKKPQETPTQKPIATFDKDLMQEAKNKVIRPEQLLGKDNKEKADTFVDGEADDDGRQGKGKGKGKGGAKGSPVDDRKQRKANREERARRRKNSQSAVIVDGKVVETDDESRHRGHRPKKVKKAAPGPIKKDKIIMELPITVRSLSEQLGIKSVPLLFKLKDYGLPASMSINSEIDVEIAEEIALENGTLLEIKRSLDAEDHLLAGFDVPDEEKDLLPRAPVVTVMGHVDHGKTSLLDQIRRTNVVSTEAGGITQVIRAWRVDHGGHPITFLDTPGHEAFTKMRARGAQVTDIAVIVVAADDGIMPQTEEAIDHAKAAGVSLVIAINKVDLPNANVDKTRQQLYSKEILPDNMGGDTPFVETSASTGKGIDELLDSISLVAELKELKANPNRPGMGICLEAELTEGEGVLATLLVQNGTLRKGDVILCGPAYGRIRQMYDSLGTAIEEAGPSMPVRITGLDTVPNADDQFNVADDLSTAREISEKRKSQSQEAALAPKVSFDLAMLSAQDMAELKVIIKADFRGSIEAIRKELEKLKHEEVSVKILRAATGGISESDVDLALTSPEDTVIVGFNVVPDDRAKNSAEEKGISLRLYNVIYELTNDIKAALEGKLKPRQEVINLGRAVVRNTFKISRVGTIAGCYVTQGIIKRSAKVRLIREGVIIYPPAEKTVGLDSLKRFKDDASEVREGFECGLKIVGYDDVKVGDVIEAYRVEEIQRTLD